MGYLYLYRKPPCAQRDRPAAAVAAGGVIAVAAAAGGVAAAGVDVDATSPRDPFEATVDGARLGRRQEAVLEQTV